MSPRWTLTELTELDLRLRPSAEVSVSSTWEIPASKDPSPILHAWLTATRKQDPEATRLAQLAVKGEAWLRLALFCGSLLAGTGAALGLLRTGGQEVINVSTYLGVLVGGQLLLLLALLLSSIWLRSRNSLLEDLVLPKVIRDLPMPKSLGAWRLRLFATFQLAGMGFNLGVLAASFWKVATFDLAFGWATTLNFDSEQVTSLFSLLAAPWGGATAPTLSQVEQSRIVLLEGFTQLSADATAAWWPFLLTCVLFYGALPRTLLFVWSSLRLHIRQSRPALESPEMLHLVQRLTHPPLQFHGATPPASRKGTSTFDLAPLRPEGTLHLILPEELEQNLKRELLEAEIVTQLGITLTDQDESTGVLQVQEVWQPPLEETLRSLQELRAEKGPSAQLLILAVGFPGTDGLPLPPSENDVSVWKQKLAELKDPALGLISWESPA